MRRVAVLLNRNAQRVTPKLAAWLSSRVPPENLFVTSTVEEAGSAVRTIADRGHEAICVGGGDGTFMQVASELLALDLAHMPVLLPLRLGGGNAIHDVCGSSLPTKDGLLLDLARAASDEPASLLPLLEVDGRLAHFAGTGIDAKHVEDFRWLIKDRLARSFVAPLIRGIPSIVLTVLLRTLPRLIVEPRTQLRIVNTGGPAHRLSDTGEPEGAAIFEGATIYEGPIVIAAAATITQYSRSLTFFPFADRLAGRFQLRVANADALSAVLSLKQIFAGTYRDRSKLWDFAASSVRFEISSPTAYHVGGDLKDRALQFNVALSPRGIPILRSPPA